MDQASTLSPKVVKNEGVTAEEYATVAEHLSVLPGVNVSTDWNRGYPFGETLRSYVGGITSRDEGIPKERQEFFLSRGYSRNDRVGTSGLEQQYEAVLSGEKQQVKHTTNTSNEVVNTEVVSEGQPGKDLVLTIDMELQKRIDKIVREELKNARNKFPYQNRFMEDAMIAMLDPQTGEVLAMSGQHYDDEENEYVNSGHSVIYNAYQPGSAIKGATVLAGLDSGVIYPGERITDRPIKIKGTPEKSSYLNNSIGSVNDKQALQKSSNVYMFMIALRMMEEGYQYERNQPISKKPGTDQEMRNYYNQFGLGVKTGIDMPFEGIGYVGDDPRPGNLMDYAIGQYDTYTTLQLAQYVSTIANDGYRIRPHLVSEIRKPTPSEGELGPVVENTSTDVLNRIQMSDEYIERVQDGFEMVFQMPGGTGYSYFDDADYEPAGKTGTAQNTVKIEGTDKTVNVYNLTLVGYAPEENPEVAFAVIAPNTGIISGNASQYPINHTIGRRALDAYFDLKEERNKGNDD